MCSFRYSAGSVGRSTAVIRVCRRAILRLCEAGSGFAGGHLSWGRDAHVTFLCLSRISLDSQSGYLYDNGPTIRLQITIEQRLVNGKGCPMDTSSRRSGHGRGGTNLRRVAERRGIHRFPHGRVCRTKPIVRGRSECWSNTINGLQTPSVTPCAGGRAARPRRRWIPAFAAVTWESFPSDGPCAGGC